MPLSAMVHQNGEIIMCLFVDRNSKSVGVLPIAVLFATSVYTNDGNFDFGRKSLNIGRGLLVIFSCWLAGSVFALSFHLKSIDQTNRFFHLDMH